MRGCGTGTCPTRRPVRQVGGATRRTGVDVGSSHRVGLAAYLPFRVFGSASVSSALTCSGGWSRGKDAGRPRKSRNGECAAPGSGDGAEGLVGSARNRPLRGQLWSLRTRIHRERPADLSPLRFAAWGLSRQPGPGPCGWRLQPDPGASLGNSAPAAPCLFQIVR